MSVDMSGDIEREQSKREEAALKAGTATLTVMPEPATAKPAISFEPRWTGVCLTCGKKIWNGADKTTVTIDDWDKLEAHMLTRGYSIGYIEELGFGHKIDPICKTCSKAEHAKKTAKILKQQLRQIVPKLKKVYICPCYDCHFNADTKPKMIAHLTFDHNEDERQLWTNSQKKEK